MIQRALTLALLVLVAALPWLASAQPQPAGPEFRVNTYTTEYQSIPAVTVDGVGNFVIVWESNTQDGSVRGVFGQRYDVTGAPLGAEFRANTLTTGEQYTPAVAADAVGNFVVVWTSAGQDGAGYGVFGQRYDATGTPQGAEFRVNTFFTAGQYFSAVAMNPAGNFVVVWKSALQDGAGAGIFGQRYDAAGIPQGSEFQVNTYTTDDQAAPAVAMDALGNFVVVWEGYLEDGDRWGIFGQRYDAAGARQGSEFRANTYTTQSQSVPSVAVDGAGNFVVVWSSFGQDGSSWAAIGRRYDATGAPQGGEFQANTYTTGYQYRARVASDALGNFIVVWNGATQDGNMGGIFGQRFDAAGAKRGNEFRVNTYTGGVQNKTVVAADAVGNFVVVWTSDGQDTSSYGIFGQRYGGLLPVGLAVDASGNGVLEPGETVIVAPSWRNVNGGPLTFTGTASNLTGPAGATYTLGDPAADYGTVANAAVGTCTSNCFQLTVSDPGTRPTPHWDVTVVETIGPAALGQTKRWTLHVGESFADVPTSNPFYRFIETLFHAGVTQGCGGFNYCPDGSTTREQMAVFLLRAREGEGFTPPACTTAPFPDVPCSSPFAPWVQELVARGITAGCGGGLYCPTDPVTREQMAVFLLKTREGAAFTPPACTTAPFTDVPCSSPFAPWVQELVARAITAGCAATLYCPTDPVTRAQMAVFLTKTFGLTLYGP
jgi:hypothetical protein